ncbi:MAG: hypothetical protein K0Q77_12 [Anaerosporomusa subterranea]|jgi:hypothetical protein|nr:hypothetical protein [Anaerosporomusa subterranea]
MTPDQIKVQLCDVMLTMEELHGQLQYLSQVKQQLQQQLKEAVKTEQQEVFPVEEVVTTAEEDPA